jgi:hypothetical protein
MSEPILPILPAPAFREALVDIVTEALGLRPWPATPLTARGSGRSTRMLVDAVVGAMLNPGKTIIIAGHNLAGGESLARVLRDYLQRLGIAGVTVLHGSHESRWRGPPGAILFHDHHHEDPTWMRRGTP